MTALGTEWLPSNKAVVEVGPFMDCKFRIPSSNTGGGGAESIGDTRELFISLYVNSWPL